MASHQAHPLPHPGTHHFINPKHIPAERDFVALSTFGASVRWSAVAAAVLVMITSIYLILDGAGGIGSGTVARLFDVAANPVIGLLIGILATAAIQSSSTVTALTVAAVGTGGVTVSVAIPVMLGANIGTTITALIVSFSYLGNRESFRRAFTSASLHMWFNVVFVTVAFLLEMAFHPLQRLTYLVSDSLLGDDPSGITPGGAMFTVFAPVMETIGFRGLLGEILHPQVAAAVSIVLGTVLVLMAVRVLNSQLSVLTAATTRTILERSSGASDALGLLSGAVGTMAVQASSITVSSLLPFAATRSLALREILAITLGANVGTTLMALLTALAVPGSMGTFALQAGLVHVAFNVIGALLVLLVPPLREFLISLAEFSGRVASRGYSTTAGLIGAGYLALPALLVVGYTLVQ